MEEILREAKDDEKKGLFIAQKYSSVSKIVSVMSLYHLAETIKYCRLKYKLEIIFVVIFITLWIPSKLYEVFPYIDV